MQLDWYFLNPNTAGVFYQYDPNGNLLWQQTVGGGSTGFLEHEAATHYYWLPNEHGDILIGFDQGANSYAVYTDHLNAPRLVTKIDNPQNPKALTDTSNDLPQVSYGEPEGISPLAIPVRQWSYSPFGADLANGYEARPTTIANNFKPDLWAWVGLPETGGADPNQVAQETWRIQANLTTPPTLNIRYPGLYYDFETGLVQNWWRTYEPRIGRYVSADPIGLNGGWNRFGYAYQDGVNRYDPYGLWVWGDPLPESLVNACAGFGDGVSLGATYLVRSAMDTNDVIDASSPEYISGVIVGAAVTAKGYAVGAELNIGRNFRLAPWGNRTGHPIGRYPHYHRRGTPDAKGNTPPGQGIGRHRPWERKSTDKCGCDRF